MSSPPPARSQYSVLIRHDLPSPRRLRRSGGSNESCALPHPCRPVCTGVHVFPDLSGVLQSSQDNDIAHVLERDLHIPEITGNLHFLYLAPLVRLISCHLGSRPEGASCAVQWSLGLPIGSPTKSSAVRPSGLPRALETHAASRTLRPLGCWWTAKDELAPKTHEDAAWAMISFK